MGQLVLGLLSAAKIWHWVNPWLLVQTGLGLLGPCCALTSVPSVPKLCGGNCCLLHLKDLLGSALLFAGLGSSYCSGFPAAGKLRKLALYSGKEERH